MKKQITFEGNDVDTRAINWLSRLSECFFIRKAVIQEVKQHYDWRGRKVRLMVRYD